MISGTIVKTGASARIVDVALDRWLYLITSPPLLAEYADVIQRPHVARKYTKIAERVDNLLDYLRHRAILVPGIPAERYVVEDADDDAIIAAALEGRAHYIVSGDHHLLNLAHVQDVRILAPRDFVIKVLKEPLP